MGPHRRKPLGSPWLHGGGVDHSPRCGVRRTVEVDVRYVLPRELRFGTPSWSPTGDPRVYEMDLGTEEPPSPSRGFGTLQSLARSLRDDLSAHGPVARDDARLQLLDWLVDQFLLAIDHLHKQTPPQSGFLFDPSSVVYYRAPGGYQLALPDVGFRWQLGPETPAWLSTHSEFERLWHPATLYKVNLASFDARQERQERQELVALARLLAWVMTGEIPLSIPHPIDPQVSDPEAYSFWHDKTGDRRFIWEVLYRILGRFPPDGVAAGSDGRITSVEQLRTEVRRCGGLSKYFAASPPPPPPWPWAAWIKGCLRAGLVLAVLGLTGYSIYYYITHRPPPLPPPALCPDCPTDSVLYPLLCELEPLVTDFDSLHSELGITSDDPGPRMSSELLSQQLSNLEQQAEKLKKLHDTRRPEAASTAEDDCLKLRNQEFLGLMAKQYRVLILSLHHGIVIPSEQNACLERLAAVYRQFKEFPFTDGKDPPWYQDLLEYSAQYGAASSAP